MIRVLRWISGSVVVLGFLYLGCLLWPSAFFSYHTRYKGNISVYTSNSLPSALAVTMDSVASLLSRSPLYDTSFEERVFIAGDLGEFSFFTRGRTYLGGLCDDRLTRNIFIHPADLRAGRLEPFHGWRDERPLSYFIAHEITHSLCSHYLGRWHRRVPVWLWEGYADYIGLGASLPALTRSSNAFYVGILLRRQDIRSLLSSPPTLSIAIQAARIFADSLAQATGHSAR